MKDLQVVWMKMRAFNNTWGCLQNTITKEYVLWKPHKWWCGIFPCCHIFYRSDKLQTQVDIALGFHAWLLSVFPQFWEHWKEAERILNTFFHYITFFCWSGMYDITAHQGFPSVTKLPFNLLTRWKLDAFIYIIPLPGEVKPVIPVCWWSSERSAWRWWLHVVVTREKEGGGPFFPVGGGADEK